MGPDTEVFMKRMVNESLLFFHSALISLIFLPMNDFPVTKHVITCWDLVFIVKQWER